MKALKLFAPRGKLPLSSGCEDRIGFAIQKRRNSKAFCLYIYDFAFLKTTGK